MRFIKIKDQAEAQKILLDEIQLATAKHANVTWLVSGGSNVALAAEAFKQLKPDELGKITILLSDERFVAIDSPDSNYLQLSEAGVDFSKVKSFPVLKPNNTSLVNTAAEYAKVVSDVFAKSEYIIGQMGIGPDGHTVGILPNSPGVDAMGKTVVAYEGFDFQRISISLSELRKVSKALVFALGDSKIDALNNLKNSDLSLAQEPAQIYKQLPDVYIISDMIGDEL